MRKFYWKKWVKDELFINPIKRVNMVFYKDSEGCKKKFFKSCNIKNFMKKKLKIIMEIKNQIKWIKYLRDFTVLVCSTLQNTHNCT